MQQSANCEEEDKRKCKFRIVTPELAEIIVDVREYFEREKKLQKQVNVCRVTERTAECLGISRQLVSKVCKKVQCGEEFPVVEKQDRDMEVPESIIPHIRKVIMGMYQQKKHVTLDTLLLQLKNKLSTRQTKWKWSRTTLYKLLTSRMNYNYTEKKSHYESLKENVVIAEQRVKYIKQVKAYRDEGRAIFYQDETWVTKNMTPLRAWLDENREGAPSLPQGKGQRTIICNIGNEDGFVEQARLIYRGKKALKNSDYHTEMNSEVFQKWMENNVFGAVPAGSVIVLDRATYHMKLTEDSKPAPSNFTKENFANWLLARKIKAKKYKSVEDFLKLKQVELAAICKKHEPKPKYEIVEMAKKHNLKILYLPVAHPELNPIEMIWAMLKEEVKKKNTKYSLADVEKFANEFFDTYDESEWKKCIDHVKKIEDEYLEVADEIPVAL